MNGFLVFSFNLFILECQIYFLEVNDQPLRNPEFQIAVECWKIHLLLFFAILQIAAKYVKIMLEFHDWVHIDGKSLDMEVFQLYQISSFAWFEG